MIGFWNQMRFLLKKKILFRKITKKEAKSVDYVAIKKLSIYLEEYSGEQVLILLDEYDAAIHAGFYYNFYDEIISLMKMFLLIL